MAPVFFLVLFFSCELRGSCSLPCSGGEVYFCGFWRALDFLVVSAVDLMAFVVTLVLLILLILVVHVAF